MSTEEQPRGGVVIGDDGSECAEVALRYAVQEARRRGVPLHVVRAWTVTTAPRPQDAPFGYVPSEQEFEQAVIEETRQRVEQARDGADIEVRMSAVHGAAARALITAAEGADLLVVGSRGRGGFASLVLGSVADTCTRHSPAPVVVVR
jgi:nucleotide-binding universal stress UspA family protein